MARPWHASGGNKRGRLASDRGNFQLDPLQNQGTKIVNRARAGFTLIELLVVLAVLGLLASMLLPILARTKESARQTTCLNNLRQLGIATQLYWDDHQSATFR